MSHPEITKRCLLVAPKHSYRIAAYTRAARDIGVQLIIASDGEHSLVQELANGIHIDFELTAQALQKITRYAAENPIHAVLPSDDRSVPLCAQIAQQLALPYNSTKTASHTRRKDLSRALLRQAGLNIPAHQRIPVAALLGGELPEIPLPWVLKPLSLSASSGVIRVDRAEQLIPACRQILPLIEALPDREESAELLLEHYIEGEEVAVEALMSKEGLRILSIFDKPDPLCGPYFEETLYVTPSRHSTKRQQNIIRQLQSAVAALGIETGPVHAEFRLDAEDQAWVLEIATRSIGGDCARTLEFIHGHSLESMIIANALDLSLSEPGEAATAAGVMMIPTPKAGILRRVEGIMAAQAVAGIESVELAVREGHELQTLPQASSYLGFIFARGDNPALVEQALRESHRHLNIVVAPLFKAALG